MKKVEKKMVDGPIERIIVENTWNSLEDALYKARLHVELAMKSGELEGGHMKKAIPEILDSLDSTRKLLKILLFS